MKQLTTQESLLLVRVWDCHELTSCFSAEDSLSFGGLALRYIEKESDVTGFKVRLLLDMLAHGVDMEALRSFMKEQK
ncbi:hypothetical protein EON64_13870 [archaeon]|nr:MAG: hypothetical protein EON64_13870 [archaeon]